MTTEIPDVLTIYQAAPGDHRWTLTAPNGQIIGASTEGYRRRIDCRRNVARVLGIHVGRFDRSGQVHFRQVSSVRVVLKP